MNLNRVAEPQNRFIFRTGSNLETKVEPTMFEPRFKFFKFGLRLQRYKG